MKRPKYYYGIFKVSPNNKNPTFYEPGSEWHNILKHSAENELKYDLKVVEALKKDADSEFWKEQEKAARKKYDLSFVKKENEVFYVCDGKTFEIIEETYDVWHHGNFSEAVKVMMEKYGLKYDKKQKYATSIRTDSTMDDLKENIRITEELDNIPDERWKEMEDLFKNPGKDAQEK